MLCILIQHDSFGFRISFILSLCRQMDFVNICYHCATARVPCITFCDIGGFTCLCGHKKNLHRQSEYQEFVSYIGIVGKRFPKIFAFFFVVVEHSHELHETGLVIFLFCDIDYFFLL